MIDHVTIRVSDVAASRRFYDTVLGVLGLERSGDEWGDFSIATGDVVTRRLHLAFFAPTEALVGAFWQAGVDAGYHSAGEPGPRPQYTPGYYGGFLLDPDGNSIEACLHETVRPTGNIDHLWLRVRDLRASRGFYATIAPHATLQIGTDTSERVQFRGPGATFSLVPSDDPTEHVHLAFPGTRAQVDAFHAAATTAGHRDNGAPGERAHYHPGYYAAFVLDPDANNVEVVDHGRD